MIRVLVLLVVTATAIFPMFGINAIIQRKICRETDFISSSFDDNGFSLENLRTFIRTIGTIIFSIFNFGPFNEERFAATTIEMCT